LAQDVESILPSAVSTSVDGYKSLNYIDFIPHLVGAIKEIIQTDSVFSGTLASMNTSINSLTLSITSLTNSYTTLVTNMTSLRNTLDAQVVALNTQSLALSQMQGIVSDLQSQVHTLGNTVASNTQNNTNSGESTGETTVINNYYTTIVQTGSSNTGSTITDSIDHSGSLEWTHSGLLLTELTGSTNTSTNNTTTGTIITPRIAVLYISELFDTATDVVHDFVALQITAVHGYFDEIWSTKISTKELVAETLCVGTSENKTCITKTQLDALLANMNQVTTNNSAPSTPSLV
jgi:uncharacterized protein YoxC